MPHEFVSSSETLSQTRLNGHNSSSSLTVPEHGGVDFGASATDSASESRMDTAAESTQGAFVQEASVQEAAVEITGGNRLNIEPQLEALARRFQQASRLHRLRVRRAIWMGVAGAFALMLVNIAAMISLMQTERYPFAPMWWLWVVNVLIFGACVLYPLRSAHVRRTLAAQLAEYEDVRAVGPLADLLTASDPRLRKTARVGLIRLLPLLTPGDAHWLLPEQRDRLCQVLEDAERQPELAEAILRAFAQVGDAHVLGAVRRVADMRARAARHKLLKATARECLPILRARIGQENARQTLLRPHTSSHSDPATLLRGTTQADAPRPTAELLPPAPSKEA